MHQWSHRVARSAATLTAVWVVTIGAISTGGLSDMKNSSGPSDVRALALAAVGRHSEPPSYQADASATVLRLGALVTDEHRPALAGLRLGTATAAVDTASHPRSLSSAVQVTGADGAPAQSAVVQSAGVRGRQDGSIVRTGPGAELPQLSLGTSRLTANAHWGLIAARAAGPVGLSSALTSPGELILHPDSGPPLLSVREGSQTHAQTQLVAVPGQPTLGAQASARAELTAVTLFRGAPTELTIRFLTDPVLVAVATGTAKGGVRYAPPVIVVTAAEGRSYRLDTAGETVDIPLVGPGGCGGCGTDSPDAPITGVVRISLGGARERSGQTSVDATAAAVRVELLRVPGVGRLLDTTLGDLAVSTRVPPGGLAYHPEPVGADQAAGLTVPGTDAASPPAERPSATQVPESPRPQPVVAAPNPIRTPVASPVASPVLPRTGAKVSVLAALGLALLGLGWVVVRATRRPRRR